MRAVGYRQLWQHLDGRVQPGRGRDRAIAATRQLAKRQLTWLRKWPDLEWIYTDHAGNLSEKACQTCRWGHWLAQIRPLALNYLDRPHCSMLEMHYTGHGIEDPLSTLTLLDAGGDKRLFY